MLPPSSHKSLFQSSWRIPKWSSHGLHQELAQKLSRKRLQMFSALHMFHIPTLATWTPLYFAHSFPEYQDQHSSLQWETRSRIFFSSWQSCLFPAVVKSDFSSDCPCAADICLVRGRKITSFSPPSSLMGKTWWVLLLLCHPEKDLKGGRTDSTATTPTRDQKAESGIANRITHKGEGKTAP